MVVRGGSLEARDDGRELRGGFISKVFWGGVAAARGRYTRERLIRMDDFCTAQMSRVNDMVDGPAREKAGDHLFTPQLTAP